MKKKYIENNFVVGVVSHYFNQKYMYVRTSRGSGEALEMSRMERRERNGVNSVTGEA